MPKENVGAPALPTKACTAAAGLLVIGATKEHGTIMAKQPVVTVTMTAIQNGTVHRAVIVMINRNIYDRDLK